MNTGSNMSFLKDKNSKWSMMRLGFLVSLVIGSIVSLAGTVAMFYDVSAAGTAITAGLAIIGTGGFSKAIQAKHEGK